MVNLIARRAIFKTRAGGTLRVTQQEAVVLRALQLADDVPAAAPVVRKRAAAAPVARELPAASTFAAAPAEPERPARGYKRRDMAAETAEAPVFTAPPARGTPPTDA